MGIEGVNGGRRWRKKGIGNRERWEEGEGVSKEREEGMSRLSGLGGEIVRC